jgi:hypothetical protein
MNEEHKTSALGLARYAQEYYDAAIAADDVIGLRLGYEITAPPPVMFLVAHSMELILKSYLRHHGLTLNQIKTLSHGLTGCFEKAREHAIEKCVHLDEGEEALLNLISELHVSTELRYIKTGPKELPVFGPMSSLATKLLKGIHPIVGYDHNA